MAKSKTEICNLAVSWLAGESIMSVDDDQSLEARLCRANYDMSRRAVLEEREWTFAIKRDTLTPLAIASEFGYAYSFLVPPDLRRSIGVYSPAQADRAQPEMLQHVLEDSHIYANIAEIHIKYIWDLTNTNKFSGLFDQTLAAHIAANIAIPLTENAVQQERMYALYENNLNKAASSDGLQGSRERLEISQMEKSRRMFVRPQ